MDMPAKQKLAEAIADHLGEQQEGASILGLAKKKASDGRGTGKPETRGWSSASSRACLESTDCPLVEWARDFPGTNSMMK